MRVLLISPNREQINMPTWPLGLACVAAAASHAGHDVQVLDLMPETDWADAIRQAVVGLAPQVIGISVRNIDDQNMENPEFLLERATDVVAACKRFSEAPIILGGAGYSMFPTSVLEYLDVGLGIQGEGEAAFPALLDAIGTCTDVSHIPGLCIRARGVKNPPDLKHELDLFPLPDVRVFASRIAMAEEFVLPVQTRRGCPMNCTYCSTATIEGRALRRRTPSKVVEWLSDWNHAGFRKLYFVDNTFNLPQFHALDLCARLADIDPGFSWSCILYPHKLDKTLVQAMARAGCTDVALGFESGCEEILLALNKRFRPDDVWCSSLLLGDYGIHRMGFLLLGGPGETKATVEQSLAFADSLGLEGMHITIGIRIYPNTPLAKLAVAEGVISAEDDLLFPKFYLARSLEDWIFDAVQSWISHRPHWYTA